MTAVLTMVILPGGEIIDIELSELPASGRITIQGRSYRITESHLSCVPRWKWVLTLA